jgi:fluoroquinolone resistance protein
LKLKGTEFDNCSLKEADFTDCDLTEASFDFSNLERAIFQNCNLTKTDFREAKSYSFEPSQNILKKTKFSKDGVMGLLSRYDIIVD